MKSPNTYTKTDFERDIEDGKMKLPADVKRLLDQRKVQRHTGQPTIGNGASFLRTKHLSIFNALYEDHLKKTGLRASKHVA